MLGAFQNWWEERSGQDLAEWCLITAFIALVALGIFAHMSGGVQNLWTAATTTLQNGNPPSGNSQLSHSPAHP